MPEYGFRCSSCGQSLALHRPMEQSAATILCRCGGIFRRVFEVPQFLDRPTSPPILRDPISRGYPGSKYPPITQPAR